MTIFKKALAIVGLLFAASAAHAGTVSLSVTTAQGTATVTSGTIPDAAIGQLVTSFTPAGASLTATQVVQQQIGPAVLSFLTTHLSDYLRLQADQTAVAAAPPIQ